MTQDVSCQPTGKASALKSGDKAGRARGKKGWNMIDVDVPEPTGPNVPSRQFQIAVVKAKDTLTIETSALPDHVYEEALMLGLKVLLNRGQSDITGTSFPDEEERAEAAAEQAKKTLKEMYEGKIRRTSGAKTAKGGRGEVMVEARRLAKMYVKDELKAAGKRVSLIKPAEITALANAWIEEDPSILEEARANVEKRKKAAKPGRVKINFGAIKEDEELAEKSAKRKKAAKKPKADEDEEDTPPPRRSGRESRLNA